MDFVSALSSGGKARVVADKYATAFLEEVSLDPDNWIKKGAHHFVGQCFRVLGLQFNVSVEDFSQTQDHPYRDDNPNYVFNPVPFVVRAVDAFFDLLPGLFAKFTKALEKKDDSSTDELHKLTDPISCYLRVIVKWERVVHAMYTSMHLGRTSTDRFFCEPLARMSFSILGGLAKMLPKYAEEFAGLKEMCRSLSIDVRYCILYKKSCQLVVSAMLPMFRVNYRTFCGNPNYALDFAFCVMTTQMETDESLIKTYEFLTDMIEEFATKRQTDENNILYLRILTNELITKKILVYQFVDLKSSRSKPLLVAILKYLIMLQYHVVSTECFRFRFREVLLQLVLRMLASSKIVSSLAAELYVKISQRQFADRDVVQHILETYVKAHSDDKREPSYEKFKMNLSRYLKELTHHYPAARRFSFYAYILSDSNARIELSLIAAQSVIILFEIHMAQFSDDQESREQVLQLLVFWPNLLVSNQNKTRSVMYGIYSLVNFELVAGENIQVLRRLENISMRKFLTDDTLSDSELFRLYTSFLSSVKATGNMQIHEAVESNLINRVSELLDQLEATDPEAPEMDNLLEEYVKNLRRVYLLLKGNKLKRCYYQGIYESIANLLLEKGISNEDLVCYGSECLAIMLTLHYNSIQESDDTLGLRISMLAQQLYDFTVIELVKDYQGMKRAKSLFCTNIVLSISQIESFNDKEITYSEILQLLITLPQRIASNSFDQMTQTYVRQMHFMFRMLLRAKPFELPNNRIWKILMQHKMPGMPFTYLSSEIEELIGVLIEHQVEMYVHSLSVILMKCYNVSGNNKNVVTVLTTHLKFMEKHASICDSWWLRFLVFQDFLNKLVKNIRLRRLETTNSKQVNRFLPLQHIILLIENMRLQNVHLMVIAKILHTLQIEAIGPQEESEIDMFIGKASKLKYECEDEHSLTLSDENYNGKRMPLPPGPMNWWQENALNRMQKIIDNDFDEESP